MDAHQWIRFQLDETGLNQNVEIRKRNTNNNFNGDVVHELAGWSPYENTAMDIIKLGKSKEIP